MQTNTLEPHREPEVLGRGTTITGGTQRRFQDTRWQCVNSNVLDGLDRIEVAEGRVSQHADWLLEMRKSEKPEPRLVWLSGSSASL